MSITAEHLINGGALVALGLFAAGVIRWLVHRLSTCEERCQVLEDRLVERQR